MSALVDFLRARFADDEAEARSVLAEKTTGAIMVEHWRGAGTSATHATRWDPGRRLAEVEFKRQLLGDPGRLRSLAHIYAAHPDYDPVWAPESTVS